MKTLLFTFDYELYLGNDTGTVQNCLIKPTHRLIDIFKKYGISGTFFVDGAYIFKMHELKTVYPRLAKDYECVISNLKYLADNGQEIQLHFHPQWLYSSYDGERWQLDFEHYKLSDVEPSLLSVSFKKSRELIEEITGTEISAYRAGGYCLSDYAELENLFLENHIKIDSSVVPGTKLLSGSVQYDYTLVPDKPFWTFSKDVTEEDSAGNFREIPVSQYRYDKIDFFTGKIIDFFDKTEGYKPWGDGENIFSRTHRSFWTKVKRKLKWYFANGGNYGICSIDYDSSKYFKKYLGLQQDIVVLVSHPKCLSKRGLDVLDKFLAKNHSDVLFNTISQML